MRAPRFLQAGKAVPFRLIIDYGDEEPPKKPLDVLFVFDCSISMESVIEAVRRSAEAVLDAVVKLNPDCRFAVASCDDFDVREVPFRFHQEFTSDRRLVIEGFRKIEVARQAGSVAEAYANALNECAGAAWRPDAKHFLVFFGDAPAHDPDFYGTNFGVDAGPDRQPGTADDLRLRDVVKSLADRKVSIVAIYDDARDKDYVAEAIKGFEYFAEQTGGVARPISSASEAAEAVVTSLRQLYSSLLVVAPLGASKDWINLSPLIAEPDGKRFMVDGTVTAPPGAAGSHHLTLLGRQEGEYVLSRQIGPTGFAVYVWSASNWWKLALFPVLILPYLLCRALSGGKAGKAALFLDV